MAKLPVLIGSLLPKHGHTHTITLSMWRSASMKIINYLGPYSFKMKVELKKNCPNSASSGNDSSSLPFFVPASPRGH